MMKTKDLKKGKYKASQKKTVFLTGIGGFIASHTVEHIIKNTDWNIIGVDSFRHKGDPLRVTDIETFDPKRITIHHADLSAPLGERLEARIGRPDYIISMASESHVDRSIEYPVPFIQNNVNLRFRGLPNPDSFTKNGRQSFLPILILLPKPPRKPSRFLIGGHTVFP